MKQELRSPETGATQAPATPSGNTHCPLCGGANACAPAAAGSFNVECWCKNARIAREMLETIPDDLRGKACICPTCAGITALADNPQLES